VSSAAMTGPVTKARRNRTTSRRRNRFMGSSGNIVDAAIVTS
jgi:hypothetical protein